MATSVRLEPGRGGAALAAISALTLVLAACGGAAAGDAATDISADSAAADAGADSATADTSATDSATDSSDADPADAPDTAADPCPGGPGCSCAANADCDSSFCIETPQGARCTAQCVNSCDEGFDCKVLGSGPDVISICLPRWNRLCDPCLTSNDCASLGQTDAVCVDHGDAGAFCATACAVAADCPPGYICRAEVSLEGKKGAACVPAPAAEAADGYGVCACSPAAIARGAQTACVAALEVAGKAVACAGSRACKAGGLAPCAAGDVSAEACDGADNDCDGATDDVSCDDGNACTSEVCAGADGCLGQKLDGLACDADGDACTDKDACVQGACVPGAAKVCDDGNPCTADACDKAKGCVQSPDGAAPCSDDNPCTVGDACSAGACQPGAPKLCESGQPCVAASCNLATGQCGFAPAPTGKACDDSDLCTKDDGCDGGVCVGAKVTCDDANVCTDDACAAQKGCFATPASAKPCSDGNDCTVEDACAAGSCKAGGPKACNDGNPCTADGCNQATGKCAVAPLQNGTPCGSDGAACQAGLCTGGCAPEQKKVCHAGNVFWQDGCGKQGALVQACAGDTFCANAACEKGQFEASWLVTADPDSQSMGVLGTAKFPPSVYSFKLTGGGAAEAATSWQGKTYTYKGKLEGKVFEGGGGYSEGDVFPVAHVIKLLWTFEAADPPSGKALPDAFTGFIYDTVDTGILGTINLIWKVKGVRQ